MTIQVLFNRVMALDNERDLIAGGDDVTRGLVLVNMVQDWFEAVAAGYAEILRTHSTFTTTASGETTTWPTGLLRLDSLWYENSNGEPVWELEPLDREGGHVPGPAWPFAEMIESPLNLGTPREYDAAGPGSVFYWSPKPDAVYTMRAYGLWAKADYAAAGDTFLYPDSVALVIVPFVAKAFKAGLDRELGSIQSAAGDAFRPVIEALRGFNRTGAGSRRYSEIHTE